MAHGDPWVRAGPIPVPQLQGWETETAAGLRSALTAQCLQAQRLGPRWPALCDELAALPTVGAVRTGDDQGRAESELAGTAATDAVLRAWIAQRFDAWTLSTPNGAATGLLTGYYEPMVTGSRLRREATQVALYALPAADSPARLATRAALHTGALDAALTPLALVWLDDPVEAFFLQIQGSGRVLLPDGATMRVGFAGHNGQDYFAIGRTLIERGAVRREDMSAQAIRQWLAAHPEQAQTVMNLNPRYVFFRELPDADARSGPIGSLGVPLTAGRSVATDRRYLPPGALLWVSARKTDAHLAVSQDTGAAIRGAVRADLFMGSGDAAGESAGRLAERLQMWLLWPRGVVPPGKIPFTRADRDD